jgi:two-component system LytT family response regulator
MKRISKKERADLTRVVADAQPAKKPLDRLLIREGSKVHVIPVEKIDYIEAQDDYFSVKTDGKKLLKQGTLSSLEEELDPKQFIRIHRSYILNIDRLSKIEPYAKDSRVTILTDGTRLQVSRAGYSKLKDLLGL